MKQIYACSCLFVTLLGAVAAAAEPDTRPPDGLRDGTPQVHAFVGGKIVVAPGHVIESGTLVVRDGTIVAVGADVAAPADARVREVKGKTIYPGLIDAYSEVEVDPASLRQGAPYWNEQIRPQISVAAQFKADGELNKRLRSQGVTARLAAPKGGIIKGSSAVVMTGDGDPSQAIVAADVAQHVRLTTAGRFGSRDYPNSPMGAVALARQAMLDAQWHRDAWRAYNANHNLPRPERSDALSSLEKYTGGESLVLIDAASELFVLRADRFAREFGLNAAIVGSGYEYRRLDAIRATGRTIIVPLNFPKAPNVGTAEAARNVSLERLLDWDTAPENPARLEQAGVAIAFTSHGLKEQGKLLAAVRTAIERGLSEDAALRAMTTTPAKLLGVDNRLGSLAVGNLANFVVADGPLFAEKTKLLETWVSGERYVLTETPNSDVRGQWTVAVVGSDEDGSKPRVWSLKISGEADKPAVAIALDKSEVKFDHVTLRGESLTATLAAKEFGGDGVAQFSAIYSPAGDSPEALTGNVTWPDGTRQTLSATRTKSHDELTAASAAAPDENDPRKATPRPPKPLVDRAASFAVNYPLGAFGVVGTPDQPAVILFKGATVWTCGPDGVLETADVLVRVGKIAAVAKELAPPEGAIIVDCKGMHITPGIIDCHSHMASDGGINEATQSITAEVRVGDFIDPSDVTVYRQLGGGVTAANILHGSANTIGGQNQVIKLRWGAEPEAMKFADAPLGIKFALGENVKQSNWGENNTTRYPQTRLGVEQILIDEFEAAKAYRERHARWNETHAGLPPRRDLELDAIVEIIEGKRWIHCHSYRQDEILAFLRTMELYDVKVGTLQHILEGYKVSREIAEHGAMASSFADWWAYKFEVYDAIPYNGAIMHNAGIVVSFNSDDAEMGRHLNHEAAKAMKYGSVPAAEALKFVTLNPAKQLRIDQQVGSLEAGKDADLVVWSGDPLSCLSRCEQTWIDGRRYFDRAEDLARRKQAQAMRATLVQKILASGAEMAGEGETDPRALTLWPREDIYCGASGRGSR